MDDLNAKIAFLEEEIRNCKTMSSAASNLSGALSRIGQKFDSCTDSLSSGGFTVDGVGADTYAFGGYKSFNSNNIAPIISNLGSICATISKALIRYDKDLTDLIYERDMLKKSKNDKEKDKKIPLSKLLKE